MNRLMVGPTNWLAGRHMRGGGVGFGFADYQIAYGQLPANVRVQIERALGRCRTSDPFFEPGEVDCGHFKLSVLELGNTVIGLQPARGYNIDPTETYHSPDLVPPHNYLAFYFLAAERVWRPCDRAYGQAREHGVAAGQGAGAVGSLLSGSCVRSAAASLSVHRQ